MSSEWLDDWPAARRALRRACEELARCEWELVMPWREGAEHDAVMHAALAQRAVNDLMAEMPGELVDEVSVELLGPGAPAGEE